MTTRTVSHLPFAHPYELDRLGKAGALVSIRLKEAEREKLARFLEIEAVESFVAEVSLTKHSSSRFGLNATLTAEIVQACVVTLEPVRSKVERSFRRELYVLSQVRRALPQATEAPKAPVEDEVTEEIASSTFDLAGPLIEELSLAIDPYPRAPGVAFETPKDDGREDEGPFAALKALKNKGKV